MKSFKKIENNSMMDEFLKITFLMDDEQQKAIDNQIPMTQNLFNSCIERCMEIGAENHFFQLLEKYPDYVQGYAEEIEKEISRIELPAETPEQREWNWKRLVSKIREIYGEDAL